MSWQSPIALWLALALPAIVALWLLRPHRPRRRVPSVMLWPASPAERQSTRPWQRPRRHRLLWLQLAVAALLALAAARPFMPASAAAGRLVVLLDASGSMRARDVAPDRFADARAAVIRLAEGLGPGQRLSIVRLDADPRVLVADTGDPGAVEAALAGEEPSYGAPNLALAVALATGLVDGPAEWLVVGDGGIDVPPELRRPAGTAFRHIRIGGSSANVAVAGLTLRRASESVAAQARLRNTGDAPVSGRLQLHADSWLVGAREWRLEPRSETQITWTDLPADARLYEARLAGVPEAANLLAHDDRAWAVLAAPSEPDVLLVSSGNSFLERLFAVHGGLRPFRAAPSDWPALLDQGRTYPLTVLDRLSPRPTQLDVHARPPLGNLLVVGPPIGEEFRPGRIWPRADHPLLRNVDLSEVSVATARRVPLEPGWEVLVDSDGGPLVAVRSDRARREVLLTFELGSSDLPLRPAYPVLMANLLAWLLPRAEEAPRAMAAGAAVAVESLPSAEEIWVESVDGSGRERLAPPWPPRPFQPPAPGMYRIVQVGPGLRQETAIVADGYHPGESDPTPRVMELPAGDGSAAPVQAALALWPWLAGAVLALSMIEWWTDARGT